MPKEDKVRKRMVVEEVGAPLPMSIEPVEEKNEPLDVVKEKVEELQTLTEDISQSVEKSVLVQEDLAKAAEEAVPDVGQTVPVEKPISLDNDIPETPLVPEIKNSSGPNPLAIIIPGIFLLGALLGGIYFYQASLSNQKQVAGGTATPTPDYTNTIVAGTPTATPTVKLDLTKYPINVMNGSGISGQANVVKGLLTTAGFAVPKTGNAASYDFTKTVIKAKADVPAEFLTQLTTTLSKSYVMDINQTLATSSADSVQVIIGSTKAK